MRPKTHIDALLQKLRQEARDQRVSNRKLATRAELHPNTLAGFHKDGWAPSIATIRALERVLLRGAVEMTATPAGHASPIIGHAKNCNTFM